MIFVCTVKSFVSGYGELYIFWYYKVGRHMSTLLVIVLLLKKCCAQPAFKVSQLQGGSNMTGTDLCVNKPHCAAAVRP